ncbi:MAG: response regulator transcription factor [Bacteroidota bacterium]
MIKILIVDDHQVLADGIKALISEEPDFHVVQHTSSGKETLSFLDEKPLIDLVLLDISLPDISGIDLCKLMIEKYGLEHILALTMHHESEIISKMIKSGAKGYLLKNTSREELITAIHKIHQGETYLSQPVTERLLHGMQNKPSPTRNHIQKITRREKEILKLIIDELTTEEIAEKLFISPTTVISHRKSLLRKVNAKNTAGLVRAAYEYNLLD